MDTQTEAPGGPEQAKRPRSIYAQLPEAFAYPFRGMGWAVLAAGAVCFWVLNALLAFPSSGYFGIFKLLLAIGIGGYLCAYMIRIIGSSADGREELPDWPELTNFWDDILRPLLLVISTALFSFLPLIVHVLSFAWSAPGDATYPRDALYWLCLGWGLMYLPMALIAVALFDSFMALNPLVVIGGILKTLPAYLFAAAIFFVCYFVSAWVKELISAAVPVVGSLIAGAVALYFLMVEMHVLGLLYNTHAKRLGWFER